MLNSSNPITSITRSQKNKTYDLQVSWSLHNRCNYACSYCPEELHNGDFSWLKLNDCKTFIDMIQKRYIGELGKESVLFSFTGGEPTLWKGFQDLLVHINSYGFKSGLTSNGNVSLKFWEKVITFFDFIALSFHPESADPDKFIKTFEYIHNHKGAVCPSVRIMIPPNDELFAKCKKVYNHIKKNYPNWTIECVHILDDYGRTSIPKVYNNPEIRSFLEENTFISQFNDHKLIKKNNYHFDYIVERQNGNKEQLRENSLVTNNEHYFKDWYCAVGLESLFVSYLGQIHRAGCLEGGIIGQINHPENISFPDAPIKCKKDLCHCPTDIRITKYKIAPESFRSKIEVNKEPISIRRRAHGIKGTISLTYQSSYEREHPDWPSALISLGSQMAANLNCDNSLISIEISTNEYGDYSRIIEAISEIKKNNFTVLFGGFASNQTKDFIKLSQICDRMAISFHQGVSSPQNFMDMVFKVSKFEKLSRPLDIKFLVHSKDKHELLLEIRKEIISKIKRFNLIYIESFLENDHIDSKTNEFLKQGHGLYQEDPDRIESKMPENQSSNVHFDNGSFKGTIPLLSDQDFQFNFKSWQCNIGNELIDIDAFGTMKTSRCGSAKIIGNFLKNELPTFPIKSTICQQNNCQDFVEQNISKST